MIHLDNYYRLIADIKPIGGVDEPGVVCNYTPYSIFVLETRLFPMIYRMFPNIPIRITFQSLYNYEQNRMNLNLVLTKLEDTQDPFVVPDLVKITEDQEKKIKNKIFQILSNDPEYALIDTLELYNSINPANTKNYPQLNSKIPFSYFSKMLQYVGKDDTDQVYKYSVLSYFSKDTKEYLDSSYNPYIQPEGIYLSFNPKSDYNKAYHEVCNFVIDRITEFYEKGTIVLDNIIDSKSKDKLIKDWHLIPIEIISDQLKDDEIPTLYEPDWIDERFAKNPADFLTRKIEGDPFIYLRISDNLVKRHGISAILQRERVSMVIEGSYLKIEVENLEQAQKIASLVDSASSLTTGKVLVLASNRLSEIYLYFEYAEKLYGSTIKEKGINDLFFKQVYNVDSNEIPYIFSCMLPNNETNELDILRKQFRDYVVERLINVSKISKFKNMSPHDIIEQEYS